MHGLPADERRTEDGHERVHVLHVDDDVELAEVTGTFLERESDRISVETAHDATAGLERLADGDVDCVVSDYDMPGRDGVEFLEAVRETHPDLPFVLFTGKGSEEIASEAVSAGVTDYLQKETGTDQYAILANRIENLADQYRSQRALEASQRRLSLFIDQSPLGVIEWNADFELVDLNPAAEEILGFSTAEVRGDGWRKFVPETVAPEVTDIMGKLQEDAGGYHNVNENVTKDGETIYCEWYNRVVTDDDDEVVAVFSQFQDVTERRERQRELEAEREFVGQALDVLEDIFYVSSPDGDLERVNRRATEVSGYSEAEILSMNLEEFFPPDERQHVVASVGSALETGSSTIEADLVTSRGERVPYEFRTHRLTDADGEAIGVAGVGRDVSDRRRHERAVTELHDVAVDLDAAETVDEICRRTIEAAEEVLRFEQGVMAVEEGGRLVIRAESSELPPDATRTMSVDEGLAGRTYRTGESFLVDDVQAHPVADPAGPYHAAISVPVGDHGNLQVVSEERGTFDERDLELTELLANRSASALERLERTRALERKNERLEQFASLVSHDLRGPLSVASGQLELARERDDRDRLARVATAHDRIEALIDDLATLARTGERVSDPEPINVGAETRAAIRTVDTADATVAVESEQTVRGDAQAVRRLLENLLRNAVEHGGDDVTVTVGNLPDGFYVADDGDGVPAADRERVFERGYSTPSTGSGLGLFIVRRIAEAHGWSATVTESADGGARIEIEGIDVGEG